MDFAELLSNVPSGALLDRARSIIQTRMDSIGWSNEVTGFGTERDKTTYTCFDAVRLLTPEQISNIYHGDDLASRMVDIVPDEMLRKGFSVDVGDVGRNSVLADIFSALEARAKLADGIRWGRCFGGAAVLIGADDKRPAAMPLMPERAQEVSYLYVLDRRYLWPLTWYETPGHPKLGQAETYMVMPSSFHTIGQTLSIVHESRLLLFGGATTGIREREVNFGWDHSVLLRAYEAMRSFNSGWRAVETMLVDGNQAIFTVRNMGAMLGANGEDAVRKRLMVVDLFRSVMRAIVLDAGNKDTAPEKFERQSVSFEQIPALLDKLTLRLCAAVKIPATIMMGQSPAGLNATGDSDYRWFYDQLSSQQSLDLEPQIRRLTKIILATKSMAGGKAVDRITTKFPPLWTETPLAEAQRRLAISQADSARILSQELLPSEVALTRAAPDGYDHDVVLTDEGKAARETELKGDLQDMKDPPEPPPPIAAPPTFGARPATDPGVTDPAEQAQVRADATDDVLDQLKGCARIIIAGGPRSGKSTTAARAGERYGRAVRSTDSLMGEQGWSDSSATVATWFDAEGDWIVEGVATPRALRKWMRANPGKSLDATVLWFASAVSPQTDGQRAMSKGVRKVWNEIRGELQARGVKIIERDS